MGYWYVPAFVDDDGVHLGEMADGQIQRAAPGPSYRALTYDASTARFVLQTPNGTERPGWEEKTADEVDADYPGVR